MIRPVALPINHRGQGPFEIFVIWAGGLSGVICFVIMVADGRQHLAGHHEVLIAFVAAIAVGELFRIVMPTGRILAPVASSAAAALMLVGEVRDQPDLDLRAASLVVVVAASMGIGVALRLAMGMSADPYLTSARLVGVAIIGGLWRQVGGTGSLAHWQRTDHVPPWQAAGLMLMVGCFAVLIELTLTGLVRAERQRARPWASLHDEFGEAKQLSLSLVTTGPLIALTAPVIGLLALPLAMVPVVITHIAVRRYAAVRQTYRETIAVLSRLTEAGGFTPTAHAERVALVATQLGRHLGLVERELRTLEYAALLHDLGQLRLRSPIPRGATIEAAPDDQAKIAASGAAVLRHAGQFGAVADIVERQAAPYRLVREMGRPMPLPARILKVANAFDDLTGGSPRAADTALERIQLGLGYEYDPQVVEALIVIVGRGDLHDIPGSEHDGGDAETSAAGRYHG